MSIAVVPALAAHKRDARVDFFRGLALFIIFIDHVPHNVAEKFTLHSFGFADAADVFVLLAGYASYLAYTRVFDGSGWRAGLLKVLQRMRALYIAHLAMLILCVGGMALAARAVTDATPLEDVVDFAPFFDTPGRAFRHALSLTHQPTYMDILPLYIVLLAWLPILLWLGRVHVALAAGVSAALWLAANVLHWNLPNHAEDDGWYFNPFAWQLLFGLGVLAAYLSTRGVLARARRRWLLAGAVAFAAFALLVVAPWTMIPGLENARLISPDWFETATSKQNLSLWRVAHIASLAYIAAWFIPIDAGWLRKPFARRIVDCGHHSLPVFCLGILLSILGGLFMFAFGAGWPSQVLVNTVGIIVMAFAGWKLSSGSGKARQHSEPDEKTPAEVFGQRHALALQQARAASTSDRVSRVRLRKSA